MRNERDRKTTRAEPVQSIRVELGQVPSPDEVDMPDFLKTLPNKGFLAEPSLFYVLQNHRDWEECVHHKRVDREKDRIYHYNLTFKNSDQRVGIALFNDSFRAEPDFREKNRHFCSDDYDLVRWSFKNGLEEWVFRSIVGDPTFSLKWHNGELTSSQNIDAGLRELDLWTDEHRRFLLRHLS